MPHLRCRGCGVVSWAPMRAEGSSCPACGLPRPRDPQRVIPCGEPERRLGTLVRMTRELLDADVVMLTEIVGDREHARVASGELPGIGEVEGGSLAYEDTYCRLMLEGLIPHLVPDTVADPLTAELPLTRDFGVRAYLGVPVSSFDAATYVLCCLARETRPGLGPREVKLLCGLAESVGAELSARAVTSAA